MGWDVNSMGLYEGWEDSKRVKIMDWELKIMGWELKIIEMTVKNMGWDWVGGQYHEVGCQ